MSVGSTQRIVRWCRVRRSHQGRDAKLRQGGPDFGARQPNFEVVMPHTAVGDLPGPFRVETQRNGTSALVALIGELDMATVGAVDQALGELRGDHVRRLVIDLRRLTFVGSTGLRLLLELEAGSQADGYELVIVQGPSVVHRVFELTGLEDRLPFVEDPEAAGLWPRD
jgi:anti-sigma B factor antagonist